jgi:hypothetical protein
METSAEKIDNGKIQGLFYAACRDGKFGRNIIGLSSTEFSELKTIILKTLESEINLFAPGFLAKFAVKTRGKISRITGGTSPYPENVVVLQKLLKELEGRSAGSVDALFFELE